MSKYNPPYGALDFLLSGSKGSKRMSRASDAYRREYYQGKGQRDGSC